MSWVKVFLICIGICLIFWVFNLALSIDNKSLKDCITKCTPHPVKNGGMCICIMNEEIR